GLNVHTFNAVWSEADAEPPAFLVKDAPLLADLMLLMTVWGKRRVFERPDNIEPAESPYYWPDWNISGDERMRAAIEQSLAHFRTEGLPAFPFNKVLHLLIECDQSNVAEVKGLLLMPCFDLVVAATPPTFGDPWTLEQEDEIRSLREKVVAVLDTARDPRVVADAAEPFRGDAGRLGAPRMADKVVAFYRWALEWAHLPNEVIVSHAKALNVVRNALVHRAASPEKITVHFTSRNPVIIPKGAPPDRLL